MTSSDPGEAALDERALVERARAGDAQALERLLERHQARVFRFGIKLCRDEEDARDVLQETLLAAARSLDGFRGESSLSTWLYTIARSFCIKKRRRRRDAPERLLSLDGGDAEGLEGLADPERAPERLIEELSLGEALSRALAALPPEQREVVLLRDVEGLTAPEVARVTGERVDAVKSRLHRARVRLRELLAPALGRVERGPGCPDVAAMLSRQLEGEISPEDCAAMERHLESCARCRAACDSLKSALRACRAVEAPEVPVDLQDQVRDGIRHLLAQRGVRSRIRASRRACADSRSDPELSRGAGRGPRRRRSPRGGARRAP